MDERLFLEWCALVIACAGAVCDWRTHKIPNRLTVTAMAGGLLLNLILAGAKGLIFSILGILMGFVFFLLFALGALKAGDVKLYMAVGALTGWRFCGKVLIYSVLTGGAAALCIMLKNQNGRQSLKCLWNYFVNLFLTRKFYMYKAESGNSYFCFGGCIAAGVTIALFLT